MLTVFCVYYGNKYHKGYVYALRDMVKKYLTLEHEFVCITTDRFDGITTIKPFVPYHGWWSKLNLFAPRMATGPSIYIDLDTVIIGNIDYLMDYTQTFSAPANWAQSGHGGIQSSVMCWAGNWTEPLDKIKWPDDSEKFWGDQEYLTNLLDDNWQKIPFICSYKYHCREGLPDSRIICFHGKPDPHEVKDQWLLPYTQTLHNYINNSTLPNYEKDLSGTG